MANGIMWCSVLLIISVAFSQAQIDNDGFSFPGPTERPARFPLNPTRRPGVTTPPSTNNGGSTTFRPNAAYNQCLTSCLATSEYNPVCGSDNTVYSNPGRLGCAQNCGNSGLRLVRYGQCTDNARG